VNKQHVVPTFAVPALLFVFLTVVALENQAQIDWRLPYVPGEYGSPICFSGGPHAFNQLNGLAIVNAADASGIDFSAGRNADRTCGIPDNYSGEKEASCSFTARSIAAGEVIYAGIGDFGNQVAIKLAPDNEVIIYGHLFSIQPDITSAYTRGERYPVLPGDEIGTVGGTGTTSDGQINPGKWRTHLHLELRDGRECTGTELCLSTFSGDPLDNLGNPLSWDNRIINDFVIYAYHTSRNSPEIYNYDGVAIHLNSGGIFENMEYEYDFHYTDIHENEDETITEQRYGAVVRIPTVYADQCDSNRDCESLNLTQAVAFAGNGYVGGGGHLELVDQPGADDPSNRLATIIPDDTNNLLDGNCPVSNEKVNLENFAPEVQAVTDTGEAISLSDFRGYVVVTYFWATSAGFARDDMSKLQALYDEFENDCFTVLAINLGESVQEVSAFREELGLTFPLLMDDDRALEEAYAVSVYPSAYLIDRNGVILDEYVGFLGSQQVSEIREIVSR